MTADTITAIKKALDVDMNQGVTAVDRLRLLSGGQPDFAPLTEEDAEWIENALKLALSTLESLQRENEELQRVNKRLLGEATVHSMEARGANSTIAEIYQIISGARGEPGNWNGAEPVRKYVDAAEAKVKRLREALKPFADLARAYDPPEDDDDHRCWHAESTPTIGDLRRARAALSSTGDTHGN